MQGSAWPCCPPQHQSHRLGRSPGFRLQSAFPGVPSGCWTRCWHMTCCRLPLRGQRRSCTDFPFNAACAAHPGGTWSARTL